VPSRPTSTTFAFLAAHEPTLLLLATQAEVLFAFDPVASIAKVRLFAELLAQEAAARVGVFTSREEQQIDRLRRLRDRGVLAGDADTAFHAIRKAGNAAIHDNAGDHGAALHALKLAHALGVWFERSFGKGKSFKPPPFEPPRPPADATADLRAEIESLRAALATAEDAAGAARRAAEDADRARTGAEERARLEAAERTAAEALMTEAAARETDMLARLTAMQAKATAAPAQVAPVVEAAAAAGVALDLDEAATRRLIDEQLRAAGWEADTTALRWSAGTRPQKGKNLAISEWPTDAGPADYVLFVGLMPIAIVEAKRAAKNIPDVLKQSARYARGFKPADGLDLAGPFVDADGAPVRVPFLFATNGRPYLKQIADRSGVWFRDARKPTNLAGALPGWYTPEGLTALLRQDIEESHARLDDEPTEYLGLRPYQVRAIRAVEGAIARKQRAMLLALATGTGKTRLAIGLCYRLLKTKRFRRILFLVDRSALGEQTENAFKDARLESLQTFDAIFDLKGMGDVKPEPDTKLHIATVQSLVRRVLYTDEGVPPIDAYDCIVVDECHRGYTLDREMSDGELLFRDEADFISKYRRVLEHFDAVKVGLTATPALHTRDIFGDPVFTYSYREAVVDGFLVDHEPPTRIVTALAEDGITFQVGEEVEVYQPSTGGIQLSLLPDEITLDIDQFHRRVLTENYNRVVCEQVARHIDPSLPGKTLVFCVNDAHAEMVVRLLKEAFVAAYGSVEDDAVQKITGASDRPLERIRRYKNERLPNVAVTVDLLTTGVDVPAITNLVFLRRVRSRVLYEQMLGRATRLCPEIGKEVFRVFDAVDLYSALAPYTEMKPVVTDVKTTFEQLARDLVRLTDEKLQREVLDQFVAKLARKCRHLHPSIAERVETEAGMDAAALVEWMRETPLAEVRSWVGAHPHLAPLLDAKVVGDGRGGILISHHPDHVVTVEHGYGPGRTRPEDYLDGFAKFVAAHVNDLPALLVVTQRPRDLTREALKSLRLALDRAGYPEAHLRTAWRDRTNQDIAASIIGYVRQAALGDALVPYEERVAGAMKRILASRPWTAPQRQWLERIGKQLRQEVVLDRASFDAEGSPFVSHGGFARLDKVFEGKLETILGDLADEVWRRGA
jgi:type I restriction enzyme, R subunit